MDLGPFEAHAEDLAPGDLGVLHRNWSDFSFERVRSSTGATFDAAWSRLWEEFGARGEMERREVVADRLEWRPEQPLGGYALLYELAVVRRAGEIVALRDHTAIARPASTGGTSSVVVHLSHVLVEPALRGGGLASWLRALPVETARRCSRRAGHAGAGPGIVLVAEMEHDDGLSPSVVRRLRSYAKAGFRVADPGRIAYWQPDFRSAEEIERSAPAPVPLSLVLRRIGCENEESLPARELAGITEALDAMFAVHVRSDHMDAARARTRLPDRGSVALLVPGAAMPAAREALR